MGWWSNTTHPSKHSSSLFRILIRTSEQNEMRRVSKTLREILQYEGRTRYPMSHGWRFQIAEGPLDRGQIPSDLSFIPAQTFISDDSGAGA